MKAKTKNDKKKFKICIFKQKIKFKLVLIIKS